MKFSPNFIPSKKVSPGLPVSKSCATRLIFVPDVEELDDQMTLPLPLKRIRFPWLSSMITPEASASGVSRFATHAIICGDVFLNHIPMYRFLELPGLKKPSSNFAFGETMVSPSEMPAVNPPSTENHDKQYWLKDLFWLSQIIDPSIPPQRS
ncbi:hypothetical protein L1987_62233 [Smallanthus sonchifolius]|uniref:Uncharacterized protein n=1 Tax=Smallanthus sonchifolius TaxID=185202 RepID=A0ACB9C9W7_9ASTR|nr:hypothetical protein L1987_62233 [Smallanthus sonchifolius]